jgi:hypothetical protein
LSVLVGDCREVMAEMPENSVDAIVCDPPYGLEFMGKEWDRLWTKHENGQSGRIDGKGGMDTWGQTPQYRGGMAAQLWHEEWAIEAFRVLKPGAHLLAFGGTRTYHRMVCAIEDAGFEIRDSLHWIYGSGFPKSLDVSKQIDKLNGTDHLREFSHKNPADRPYTHDKGETSTGWQSPVRPDKTHPHSEEAQEWQGWGTALKPAHEPIVLARKPLSEKNVASNVLKHTTGALNIDGCRVAGTTKHNNANGVFAHSGNGKEQPEHVMKNYTQTYESSQGRWPPNLLLSHHELCRRTGEVRRVKGTGPGSGGGFKTGKYSGAAGIGDYTGDTFDGFANPDGTEAIEAWECVESCPVRVMDEQSGRTPSNYRKNKGTAKGNYWPMPNGNVGEGGQKDTGGASRFYPNFAAETGVGDYDSSPYNYSGSCGEDSTRDESTSAGRKTESSGDSLPIDGSGNKSTGQSPKDTKSITSTTTNQITDSKTLNSSAPSGTTITTNGSEKTTSTLKASSADAANGATSTSHSQSSNGEAPEPIRDIASPASAKSSENGSEPTPRRLESTSGESELNAATPDRFFPNFSNEPPFRYQAKASRRERNAGLQQRVGQDGH